MGRILSRDVRYLFREGTLAHAYRHLGAHIEGVGARFRVWAPRASRVSVVGEFNAWDPGAHPLDPSDEGIWAGVVPGAKQGDTYKYAIARGDDLWLRADPYAFATEVPPKSASVLWPLGYDWSDGEWMERRGRRQHHKAPIAVYELHLGSWRKTNGLSLSYTEVADPLIEHVLDMGFTHVEFMPLTEHPYYPSWGYQTTSYFAPTSRFGTPQDLMALVDRLHRAGIGVIFDWVPSHFATDEHGLARFDGEALYEHPDWRRGWHPDWNSAVFDYGRGEVRSFLLSSANFWLDHYHVDGIRVDAVASMLYLDYSREEGEWLPNRYGGKEHLEAIEFLQVLNRTLYSIHPGILTVAEESTAWPGVSSPVDGGGLGFGFKWDMGWMHDTLAYFAEDPVHRKFHQDRLTFRMLYAYHENFMLPLSHDEVVHGKGSLLDKMAGDRWQRFANLRALYGYMYGSVGKKLLFMGAELAQPGEWSHDTGVDWEVREDPMHAGIQRWIKHLNGLYRSHPALYDADPEPGGFQWVALDDAAASVLAFERRSEAGAVVLFVAHLTPVTRDGYRIGVTTPGEWKVLADSDHRDFGGSHRAVVDQVVADSEPAHGRDYSLALDLPPLGVMFLAPET